MTPEGNLIQWITKKRETEEKNSLTSQASSKIRRERDQLLTQKYENKLLKKQLLAYS